MYTYLRSLYTVYKYRDTEDGAISINPRGCSLFSTCFFSSNFSIPGLPGIHEQGGVHLVTDDMLQKLGIVIGGARTSEGSWFFFPQVGGLEGPFVGEVVRVVVWMFFSNW